MLKTCQMIRYAILICGLLYGMSLTAQSVFHFDVTLTANNVQTTYSALAVIQKSGVGQVRLRPTVTSSDNPVVWSQAINAVPLPPAVDSAEAPLNLQYKGSRQTVISGDGVAPPLFDLVFRLNSEEWLPYALTAPGSEGKNIITEVQKPIWIGKNKLTKELVAQFYLPKEDFFANQFVLLSRGLTAEEKLTRMHVIIVANTTDSAVGGNSKKGMDNAETVFSEIAETMGIKTRITKIFGSNFGREAVVRALNQLNPASQDIVVFYYIGHGFRLASTTSPNPLMDLRSNNYEDYVKFAMSIDDVYRQIRSKGARLNIVLSDCCNWDVGKPLPYGRPDLQPRDSGLDFDVDKCKALFLPSIRTSILGVAADKNQLSVSNPSLGGFFFHYFSTMVKQGISKSSSGMPNWVQILEETKSKTFDKSRNTYCSRPWILQNICFQTPRYVMQ
jgi:hypothetical protein